MKRAVGSEGRKAVGYDAEDFYLGLALDERYVEGGLERIGEDDPEGEDLLRSEWEEGEREMGLEILKAGCEVLPGRPERPG